MLFVPSGKIRVGTVSNNSDVIHVTTAPNTGGGLTAELGSLAMDSITGTVWHKFGAADTQWEPLAPARYVPNEMWGQNNVAASQTNVALSTLVSQNFDTWRAVRAGSVVGIVARHDLAIVAGTATIKVSKNGAVLGTFVVTLSSGTIESQATQAAGIDTYVAGDLLGMMITTSGTFSPNTGHLEAYPQLQDAS